MKLTAQPPYFVYDANRAIQNEAPRIETRSEPRAEKRRDAGRPEPMGSEMMRGEPTMAQRALAPLLGAQSTQRGSAAPTGAPAPAQRAPLAPAQPDALSGQPGLSRQPAAGPQRTAQGAAAIQQSIARIHEASQAPTLSPQDYRTLFDVMAQEIAANGLAGQQTLSNIVKRAEQVGIDIRRDDVRFVLDVVSEADPWFDQGASPSLFASRFRNFVVARCRGQGLSLSVDELDLIEAWFAAPVPQQRGAAAGSAAGQPSRQPQSMSAMVAPQEPAGQQATGGDQERWWSYGEGQQTGGEPQGDDYPRIIRTRIAGR
ncbi:MAG: hypothetical protein WDN31_15160 [Hyphomicrobium sp.]